MSQIYLGTVALEKNRWAAGRIPSFQVSDLLPAITDNGFDGVELWQYHYTHATDEEKEKLAASGVPFYLSTYISIVNRNEEVYKEIGDAAKAIGAKGLKYNFGKRLDTAPDIDSQIENLKCLCGYLPDDTKLLCECHAGTIMEDPELAGEVFSKLDKERFGAIIHLETATDFADQCFKNYGDRIWHIHCAYKNGTDGFVAMDDGTGNVEELIKYYSSKGFNGSYAIEFVKFEPDAESHLKHAIEDVKYLKKIIK